MRGKLVLSLALAVGACGQTTRDFAVDASVASGGMTSGGIAGVVGGGTGGVVNGGGGVVSGSGGVLVGGGGVPVGGSAGLTGGGGAAGGGAFGGTAGALGGGGSGGIQACDKSNQCPPDEYCAEVNSDFHCVSSGWCAKRPKSCPGECWVACSCGGEWCSICVSRLFGHDAAPFGSQCQGFGGASSILDAGLGAPCGWYQGTCATGLKCCYPCTVPGCQGECMPPDANGMCPVVTPS